MLPRETDDVAGGGNGRSPAAGRHEDTPRTRVLIEPSTIWLAAANDAS